MHQGSLSCLLCLHPSLPNASPASPCSPPGHISGGRRRRLGAAAAAGAELLRAPGLPVGAAAPAGLQTLAGQTAAHQAEGPGGPAAAGAGPQPGETPPTAWGHGTAASAFTNLPQTQWPTLTILHVHLGWFMGLWSCVSLQGLP